MPKSAEPPDESLDASLLSRVRKLMDKAAATSNPHEADAFSRKAAELVARHRIDPHHLDRVGRGGELAVREVALGRGAYVRARLALLMAVASTHDARVVFGSTPEGMVAYVAGFGADLDAIELMYHSLHGQAAGQMADIRRSTPAATQRFRRSFLFGYADRIGHLLADARADVEARGCRVDAGSVDSVELAMRDRQALVAEFADRSFGRVRAARAPGAAQALAWKTGAAAAGGADVGRARVAGRRALGRG